MCLGFASAFIPYNLNRGKYVTIDVSNHRLRVNCLTIMKASQDNGGIQSSHGERLYNVICTAKVSRILPLSGFPV